MTSEFAVNRIKQGFLKHNLPSSLVAFCDYKLEKIEEDYLKTQEAPVDEGPDGEI